MRKKQLFFHFFWIFSKSTGPNRFKFSGNLSLVKPFRMTPTAMKSVKSFKSYKRFTYTHTHTHKHTHTHIRTHTYRRTDIIVKIVREASCDLQTSRSDENSIFVKRGENNNLPIFENLRFLAGS